MKRNYKTIIPIVLIACLLFSFQVVNKPDPEKEKILIGLIRYALTKGHYEPHKMNDEFSENVFNGFIDALDPYKRFFLQSDIDEFSQYKLLIDDQLKNEELIFYNTVYEKFEKRVAESKQYYKTILDSPFDFNIEETFNIDYELKHFAKSEVELLQIWELQLKLSTLSRLHDRIELQNDFNSSADKSNISIEIEMKSDPAQQVVLERNIDETDTESEPKTFAELEEISREATEKSLDELYNIMSDLDENDWFSVYINTITLQFDPHTNYFAPKDKKRFDISMAGKLEGIGARLQKKGDFTIVAELISGGPAWKAGELEVGDVILKVAQGDEPPIDIVGMRLDDAIEFIKGKKGTEVKLTLKKIDGSINIISIIRDVVELEETFAKSSIVELNEKKFGIINLPKFYIDFNERNFRNSATDMEDQIEHLKKENIEGLLIDLRNNGGGSLKTAIEIAGLFIKDGPIVQVKYRGEKPNVRSDKNKKIQWDGPLVILVNELSASASEIFAAAMQDYNRAIIIGSKQSFGKGTVQNVLPLNNYYKYSEDLGALKMTIQKFYRINGGSTQLKGVESDIAMPDRYTYLNIGERDEKNPLAWDKIEPADYTVTKSYDNFHVVVNNSKKRIASNPQFMLIDKNARWIKKGRDDNTVNLNYNKYKQELDKRNEESKEFDALNEYENNLVFSSPKYELPMIEKDSILGEKRKVWHKNLSHDIYVEEALAVLSELKMNRNLLVKN